MSTLVSVDAEKLAALDLLLQQVDKEAQYALAADDRGRAVKGYVLGINVDRARRLLADVLDEALKAAEVTP